MEDISLKQDPLIRLGTPRFFSLYLVHMRPYLLFVSGVAGFAGLTISPHDLNEISNFLCFCAFFLGYGFGQALTDCFQIDTDSISSPYRPLVRGIIGKKDVLACSFAGLLAIGLTLVIHNLYNLPILIASAVGLLTYTYFKKNHSFLGPFWNSWIVMLLPIAGYLATDSSFALTDVFNNKNILLLAAMSFASYANFVVIGYLKDISADKQTGYKTFPVVYGWNKTILLGHLNVAVSIILCAYLVAQSYNLAAVIFCCIGSAVAVAGQLYGMLTKEKTELNSAFPVASTVRSFILWHLGVIVAFKHTIAIVLLAIIFYFLFELVIYKRPQKEQI